MEKYKFGVCPECGSENLMLMESLVVGYPIIAWCEYGDDDIMPDDYDEMEIFDDECEVLSPAYYCRSCDHQFNVPVVKVSDVGLEQA